MTIENILKEAKKKYHKEWEHKHKEERNAYRRAYNAEHAVVKKVCEIDFFLRHAMEEERGVNI